ncbi:MAG TPA: Smr/MutS family protein [Kiloniellales bacterium]|nr:Smr/MutS family protein [Kiloniellales bacterium]
MSPKPAPPETPDGELWRRLTEGVKPLKGRKTKPPEPPAAPPAPPAPPASAPPAAAPKPRPREKVPLAPGGTAGIDRRTADRFRRGQLPIDARLDLHFLRQDAAYAALSRFLDRALTQGHRVLLVVTGKGEGREEGGVLRRLLPLWLEEGSHRDAILAIAPARRQHGGEGAFYLLLRRRRE